MNLLRPVAAAALVGVAPAAWATFPCYDNQPYVTPYSQGTRIFTAVNAGSLFPTGVTGGGYLLRCGGTPAYAGIGTAVDGNGAPVTVALAAAASQSPSSVHAAASSHVISGSQPTRNSAPGVAADAATVLEFSVTPGGAMLRFDAAGSGSFWGDGNYGLGGFAFNLTAGAAGAITKVFNYHDSTGINIYNGVNNWLSVTPPRGVQFDMSYQASFAEGDSWIQMDLVAFASGNGGADFGHTARITGVTVLTPGADVSLPAGLFTADPNQPGHYILTELLPVPEPAAPWLWVTGLLGMLGLRHCSRSQPSWKCASCQTASAGPAGSTASISLPLYRRTGGTVGSLLT